MRVEQLGRTLHIGEQERDDAARQRLHSPALVLTCFRYTSAAHGTRTTNSVMSSWCDSSLHHAVRSDQMPAAMSSALSPRGAQWDDDVARRSKPNSSPSCSGAERCPPAAPVRTDGASTSPSELNTTTSP